MSQFDQSFEGSSTWRQLTLQANRDYTLRDLKKARALYEGAMAEASELLLKFQETGLPLSTPAVFVVSCHNLAELLLMQKETAEAVRFLRCACLKLIHLARLPDLPLQARLACVEHLRPAVVVLMKHPEGMSEQHETQMLVARARTVALSVYQIAGYALQSQLEDVSVRGRPS